MLFGSFIGRKSEQTPTHQKIDFKTHGKLTITGEINSSPGNNTKAVSNLLFPGTTPSPEHTFGPLYNKQLGVWNLAKAPVVLVPNRAWLGGSTPDPLPPGAHVYNRNVRISENNIEVLLNPDVLSEIDDYTVESSLLFYTKFDGEENWNGNTVLTTSIQNKTLRYDDQGSTIIHSGGAENFYGPEPVWPEPGDIHEPIEYPNMPTPEIDKRYVVAVTVTLYPKAQYNQDPIVITRSYLPEYELVND